MRQIIDPFGNVVGMGVKMGAPCDHLQYERTT